MSDRNQDRPDRGGLTRRDLLKALPAAGAVAAGAALTATSVGGTTHSTGTCRACLARCGVRATLRDDHVVRVEGDPASATGGFVCLHGMAIREIVHSRDRVRRPLRRVGGSLEEVSWQEAFDGIAQRLAEVKQEYGPQALAVQAGWGLVAHPMQMFLMRFCQAFGTPNFATVDSVCQSALRMGEMLTTGSKCKPDANRARTLVLWGANPTVTQPLFARVVSAAGLPGRNLLVIDPVRTEAAERATLHLPVRPGTDGALALGLMHVIVEEGLHDRSYIERATIGFDRLRELIRSYAPERVAEITSVAAPEIKRAARMIAGQGPTSIWTGLGVEHHTNGLQTVRAITALSAICGDVGVPGGSRLLTDPRRRSHGRPIPSLYQFSTPHPVPPPVAVPAIGDDRFPLFELFNRQAQANLFAKAILDDDPYPLRALILVGSNAVVTAPGSERLRRAADKLSLLVSVDPFLTASGRLADYVLPAASFAEGARGAGESGKRGALIEARHDSRTDWEIVCGLATALGLGDYFPWSTMEEAAAAPQQPYMTSGPTLLAEDPQATRGMPARFPSVSGKIELYSTTLERFGHDPLPDWNEPFETAASLGDEFPLVLVSGPRTRAYINSQFRQLPSVARKMPRPVAEIHPEVAKRVSVEDGATVVVVSPRGRVLFEARVTDRVHPGCVVIPAGWSEANANLLTDEKYLDPVTGFPGFRSGVCRIEPHAAREGSTLT